MHLFFQTFYSKNGGIAVIEDSILQVLKQINKPRVLFLSFYNYYYYFTSCGNNCHFVEVLSARIDNNEWKFFSLRTSTDI